MSEISNAFIDKYIQEKKPIYLHLRNGAKITAVIIGHDDENFYLSDAVAEKISKDLVNSLSENNISSLDVMISYSD